MLFSNNTIHKKIKLMMEHILSRTCYLKENWNIKISTGGIEFEAKILVQEICSIYKFVCSPQMSHIILK